MCDENEDGGEDDVDDGDDGGGEDGEDETYVLGLLPQASPSPPPSR